MCSLLGSRRLQKEDRCSWWSEAWMLGLPSIEHPPTPGWLPACQGLTPPAQRRVDARHRQAWL